MDIFESTAGSLRQMSAEVPERINASWSVHDGVGHPHSVINTNPKTVDLLAVLDEDMGHPASPGLSKMRYFS